MIFKREQSSNYSYHVKPISPVATEQKGVYLAGYSTVAREASAEEHNPFQRPFLKACHLSNCQHAGTSRPGAAEGGTLTERPWQRVTGWGLSGPRSPHAPSAPRTRHPVPVPLRDCFMTRLETGARCPRDAGAAGRCSSLPASCRRLGSMPCFSSPAALPQPPFPL